MDKTDQYRRGPNKKGNVEVIGHTQGKLSIQSRFHVGMLPTRRENASIKNARGIFFMPESEENKQ
jgi:hypothetical protein